MKCNPFQKVFTTPFELQSHLESLRKQGKKLVTTNGCFDIIHSGHVQYLTDAARLGDLLVVGINSDESVRKLKGPNRPIQSEQNRAAVLASLCMIDAVFVFSEENPLAFLEILKPDIHVKGGDYPDNIIEKPVVEKYGGVIKIVSLKSGYSTSSIIEKIRSS
ncbi:MAG: D-glycero-beta-D-manno-heptose 1-phosphate adenylyltransferase [Chitinivibrionales bacterium]|nr:D-glycero-beta-D-manno-heptose 1-phosphate adenylyltransferase [Chitinivibrionales bacterium]